MTNPLTRAAIAALLAATPLCASAQSADDALSVLDQTLSLFEDSLVTLDQNGDGAFNLTDVMALKNTGQTFDDYRALFGDGNSSAPRDQLAYLAGNAVIETLNSLAAGDSYTLALDSAQRYIDLSILVLGSNGGRAALIQAPGTTVLSTSASLDDSGAARTPITAHYEAYDSTDPARQLYPNPTAGHAYTDHVWVNLTTDFRPAPDPMFNNGAFSGPYALSAVLVDGLYSLGDGTGGFWWSTNLRHWEKGEIRRDDQVASGQNAPIRHIEYSPGTGTYIATTLGGGSRSTLGVTSGATGVTEGHTDGFYRSTDGKTWDAIIAPEACGIHYSATNSNGTWIAPGCGTDLLVSTDDGLTWQTQPTNIDVDTHIRVRGMGYHNGLWIVSAGTSYTGGGIFTSTDFATWTLRYPFPTPAPGLQGRQGKRFYSLGNGEIALGGSQLSVITSSDGINWTLRHEYTDSSRPMASLAQAGTWHPKYGYLFGGNGNQMIYSQDGASWVHDTRYSFVSEFQEFIVDDNCGVTLFGGNQGALGIMQLAELHCDALRQHCKPVIVQSCD